jgi:hypothetical protein
MPGAFGPAVGLPLFLLLSALFYGAILAGALIIAGRVLIGHWRATEQQSLSPRQAEELVAQLRQVERRLANLEHSIAAKE